MDWDNVVADEEWLLDCHYNAGRSANIDKIVLHHNAGDLSLEGAYNVWRTREASAHYQVDSNGRVGQMVNDWDTAWHAGNANPSSIGIEHANNNFDPWTISQATLESGAHLVAALCKMYGLGEPQWCVNVFPHNYFMATSCPGEIAGSQNEQYMNRAREWYDMMAGASGEWVRDEKGWWYRRSDGSWPAGEWLALDAWYRFGADGYALTGWQLVDGKWYLFGDDCRMLTGWQLVDGKWYYMTGSGAMATGWAEVDGAWYYLDESGAMERSSCRSIGGKWYAFGASGAMVSGNVPTGVGGDMELG